MKRVILCPNPYRDGELTVAKHSKEILEAILADDTSGGDFASIPLPESYQAAVVREEDVPMFEGLLELVLGEHLAGLAFRPPAGPPGHATLRCPCARSPPDQHECSHSPARSTARARRSIAPGAPGASPVFGDHHVRQPLPACA